MPVCLAVHVHICVHGRVHVCMCVRACYICVNSARRCVRMCKCNFLVRVMMCTYIYVRMYMYICMCYERVRICVSWTCAHICVMAVFMCACVPTWCRVMRIPGENSMAGVSSSTFIIMCMRCNSSRLSLWISSSRSCSACTTHQVPEITQSPCTTTVLLQRSMQLHTTQRDLLYAIHPTM